MTRIGVAVVLAGVISTPAVATMRQDNQDPVVYAQAGADPLPELPADGALVNVSPQLDPAPEVFDGKATAVWDGRGTLRGVWVAHPLAKTARRVRIYNLENGAVVDGAMFKRESIAGDKRVIVSSDAAEKLGLEPNTGARLRIVGVRPAGAATKETTDTADGKATTPGEGEAGDGAGEVAAKDGDTTSAGAAKTDPEKPDPEKTDTAKSGPEKATPEKTAAEETAAANTITRDTATKDTAAKDAATKTDATKKDATKAAASKEMATAPDAASFKLADAPRTTGLPPIPRARPKGGAGATAAAGLSDPALDVMAATRAAAGFKFVPDDESDIRLAEVDGFFTKAAGTVDASDTAATGAALLTEPRGDGADAATPGAGDTAPKDPATSRLPNDPGTPLKLTAAPPTPTFKAAPDSTDSADPASDPAADGKAKPSARLLASPTAPAADAIAAALRRSDEPTPGTADTSVTGTMDAKTDDVKADGAKADGPKADGAKADGEETAAADGSALEQPYVQVGLFGLPQNAADLVEDLKAKGIPAIAKPFEAGGKQFTRVLVGPFRDQVARDRVQKMVRDLGLTDAMPVKG